MLARRLVDTNLSQLRGRPLTALDLTHCGRLTAAGLAPLRTMPLTQLSLRGCPQLTNCEALCGIPLRVLSLFGCLGLGPQNLAPGAQHAVGRGRGAYPPGVLAPGGFLPGGLVPGGFPPGGLGPAGFPPGGLAPAELAPGGFAPGGFASEGFGRNPPRGLDPLRGMPLADLDLGFCDWLDDASLTPLRGLPLTRLCLAGCPRLTPAGLGVLHGMPLGGLDLRWCYGAWNDAGMIALQGLPITDLNLDGLVYMGRVGCEVRMQGRRDLTDVGVAALVTLPLTSLSMCGGVEASCRSWCRLGSLPLTRLKISCNNFVRDWVLALLLPELPLTSLHLSGYSFLNGRDLKYLKVRFTSPHVRST